MSKKIFDKFWWRFWSKTTKITWICLFSTNVCFHLFIKIFSIDFFRSSLDGKVYIGNVPTDDLTDRELLEFFRPFGKISGKTTVFLAEKWFFRIQFKDIRVYKNHLFVQYENLADADQLIEQGQKSLFLKGNKLGKIKKFTLIKISLWFFQKIFYPQCKSLWMINKSSWIFIRFAMKLSVQFQFSYDETEKTVCSRKSSFQNIKISSS